jgi:hypothetical protein
MLHRNSFKLWTLKMWFQLKLGVSEVFALPTASR